MEKDDHVRDVYAFYGLAMYWAQCVEQSMFIHLMFLDFFPKNLNNFKDSEKWASDFDTYEEKELGKTMGRLLQKLKNEGQPTNEVSILLSTTLEKRNWLAHSYFPHRAVEFTQEAGRAEMIKELQGMVDLFREVTAKLDAITMPIARRYGYTEEMEAKARAELLAELSIQQKP